MATASGYTPPQYGKPAMVSIQPTYTGNGSPYFSSSNGDGASVPAAGSVYVFDAVFVLNHEQELTMTSHPVQTGSAINTHAFLQPAELGLQIGMSDVMAAYGAGDSAVNGAPVAQWTGSTSRSISCYQTILRLQRQRVLLNITTRLRSYKNMLVMNVRPIEDKTTINGLKMQVYFKQVILASTVGSNDSARPGETSNNALGQVSGQPVTQQITTQYSVPPATPSVSEPDPDDSNFYTYLQQGNTPNVIGAGGYSSLPVQSLQTLPVPQ